MSEARLRQLPRNLLVQNVPHGDRDDDAVFLAEEAVNLVQRVAGIIEADKETLLALRPRERKNFKLKHCCVIPRRHNHIEKGAISHRILNLFSVNRNNQKPLM